MLYLTTSMGLPNKTFIDSRKICTWRYRKHRCL